VIVESEASVADGNWLVRNLQRHQDQINGLLERIGFDTRDWARVVMNDICAEWLRALHPDQLDALEISAGKFWRTLGFKSFTEANYPEYDVCADTLDERFDVIIADQIFEHLLLPGRAAQHVYEMLNPGGYFLISTPFLIRVHLAPLDCSRWTETGIRQLLVEAGFESDDIRTGSWGNRACVKANFRNFPPRGWTRSLKNEPEFPVTVWALAQKPPV
jgi:SAM-dependent methyltransferase